MNAFITEDPNDTVVLSSFVNRIIGTEAQSSHYLTRVGFGAVLRTAAPLVAQAARARCTIAVVMVDCDETDDHFTLEAPHARCRFCQLESALPKKEVVRSLSNGETRVVVTLAVRTLESWLAVGGNLSVSGSIHEFGRHPPERRTLKKLVYGSESPSSAIVKKRGTEIAQTANLPILNQTLPSFRAFAAALVG